MSEPAMSARITTRWNTGPEVQQYGTIESEPGSFLEASRQICRTIMEVFIKGGYLRGA